MPDGITPQGSVHEGDCAVCGASVRYVDYCPRIYLCQECGYPDPAPSVEADDDGHAYIVDENRTERSLNAASEHEEGSP